MPTLILHGLHGLPPQMCDKSILASFTLRMVKNMCYTKRSPHFLLIVCNLWFLFYLSRKSDFRNSMIALTSKSDLVGTMIASVALRSGNRPIWCICVLCHGTNMFQSILIWYHTIGVVCYIPFCFGTVFHSPFWYGTAQSILVCYIMDQYCLVCYTRRLVLITSYCLARYVAVLKCI